MAELVEHFHYSRNYERAVLGACMIEANAYGKIQGILTPDCFYLDDHRSVYEAISEMWKANMPIDVYTVVNHCIRQKKKFTDPKMVSYFITELTNAVVSSAHIEAHSFSIREMWIERELEKIKQSGPTKGADALAKVAQLKKELDYLVSVKVSYDWSDMTECVMKLLAHMEEVKDVDLIGLTTGLRKVDTMTSGLQPTNLIVMAARPSVGKSAAMDGMAVKQAAEGHTVGIVSLEMPKVQITARMAAKVANTDFYRIFRNKFQDQEEAKRVTKSMMNNLAKLPIFISDRVGVNAMDIKAKAAQLIYKYKCKILYIDYLQLIDPDAAFKNLNREQQVSQISRACKILAMEFGIPVVLLAQLNRLVETQAEKKPQLHNLRESGSIEQDADGVILWHRDWKSGILTNALGGSTEREADVIIAKWRNGELGNFKIAFDPGQMRFYDPDDDHVHQTWKPPLPGIEARLPHAAD